MRKKWFNISIQVPPTYKFKSGADVKNRIGKLFSVMWDALSKSEQSYIQENYDVDVVDWDAETED
jgi:hypothetical protein